MTTYSTCPEAEKIAGDVIESWHQHLQTATIRYYLTDGTKSKVVLCNPLQRFLTSGEKDPEAGADWLILLEEEEWESATEPGREALLDELLVQCGQTKDEQTEATRWVKLKGVTVFPEVLSRRGFWRDEQKPIKDAAGKQMQLGLALEAATR